MTRTVIVVLLLLTANVCFAQQRFIRGDANGNGSLEIADVVTQTIIDNFEPIQVKE